MTAKYVYLENYGCVSNKFDFEIIRAYFDVSGYMIVDTPGLADVILVNTCGVKKATEDKILGRLRFLRDFHKPLVVAGCLSKINLSAIEKAVPDYAAVLDPYSVDKIPLVIRCVECGERNKLFFGEEPRVKLGLPKARSGEVLEIVQVCEGCMGSCAFCCTRFARGKLFSYPSEVIVNKIEGDVGKGVREFWITAQDVGAYGLDIENNIAGLLKEICAVEGKFFVRVGMMNPHHVLNMLDQLIDVYKEDKIFKFLHLPVQSGNDVILKNMNRPYSVDDFIRIVCSFREAIPDITIATDIICGFPGESESAFEDSSALVRKVKPDIVNISKFFPRPGTSAMKMTQLPNEIIKMRSGRMAELCRIMSLKRNSGWLDWVGDIMIDEKGKNESWVGRNFAYKTVVIKDKKNLIGETLKVRIKKAFPTYLEGERII